MYFCEEKFTILTLYIAVKSIDFDFFVCYNYGDEYEEGGLL